MSQALILSIRLHDGRYHGQPEWPPSPARVFQALLAGSSQGHALSTDCRAALTWLERLPAPVIAAPSARQGQGFRNYVPNNDLDAVGRDPRRVAEIRTAKSVRPRLFDPQTPFLYVWRFEQEGENAAKICEMAERIYQLGRGTDMAWAWAEIAGEEEIERRLTANGDVLYCPAKQGDGEALACPEPGSLASLEDRFAKASRRFAGDGRAQQVFSQAPKPRFGTIAYNSPPRRFLFELRQITNEAPFTLWPLAKASSLVESVRDRGAEKLAHALPDTAGVIDRVFIGRNAKGADKAERIRIIPLPSIGSAHVVRSIRRLLVEVPTNCPLRDDDIAWAFSGLDVIDLNTGEITGSLVRSADEGMLGHYGIDGERGNGHRVWRTVTPVALPERAARRRIDPRRLREELAAAQPSMTPQFKEAKAGRERAGEEVRAAASVVDALRHANTLAQTENIRVQREPFEGRGARAADFAGGTRFAKERLWHAEITFRSPVRGPLVIGDGRYLGLGLMAPVRGLWRDAMVFTLPQDANIELQDAPALVHAVRRALMALSRESAGQVMRLFSGHEDDGGPAVSGRHEHIFLAADDSDEDGRIDRIVVAAPWVCDRSMQPRGRMRKVFDEVVSHLATVRAGRLGVIALRQPLSFGEHDPLVGPARVWESRTLYRATRHAGRGKNPAAGLVRDVIVECLRRSLPRPDVKILEFQTVSNGGGLKARVQLHFDVAVRGPLLLGRDSHAGGGMFRIAR